MSNASRFLQLAQAGAHPGASGGEKICHRIAVAIAEIGDDAAVIDTAALEGACQVLRSMGGPWRTDAEKAAVFDALQCATGK